MNLAPQPPKGVPRVSLGFFITLLWFGLVSGAARAETRALVLASDYTQARNSELELKNTLVDARAVSALFRKLGLRDVRVVENGSVEAWDSEVEALVGRLQPSLSVFLWARRLNI